MNLNRLQTKVLSPMNDVFLKQIAPAPARRAGASRPFVMYTIVAVSSEAVHVFAPDLPMCLCVRDAWSLNRRDRRYEVS